MFQICIKVLKFLFRLFSINTFDDYFYLLSEKMVRYIYKKKHIICKPKIKTKLKIHEIMY